MILSCYLRSGRDGLLPERELGVRAVSLRRAGIGQQPRQPRRKNEPGRGADRGWYQGGVPVFSLVISSVPWQRIPVGVSVCLPRGLENIRLKCADPSQ